MSIYAESSVEEMISLLEAGHLAGIKIGPVQQDARGFFGDWSFGVFTIKPLSPEYEEELKQLSLPLSLKTHVWLSNQPHLEGQFALYRIMKDLFSELKGDLALLNYGETVMAQRVDGLIKLRVDQMNEDILSLFKGIEYEPLLSTLDG